jgi:hypothetical protein
MTCADHFEVAGHRVHVLRASGPERDQVEADILRGGSCLPLSHRAVSLGGGFTGQAARASWLYVLRNQRDQTCGAFAMEVSHSRALPGHFLLRAERFGNGVQPESARAAVEAIARTARRDVRILRVNIELFSPDALRRQAFIDALRAAGFESVPEPRRYAKTIAVDLAADEAIIFASLHATARRHIRAVGKHPVEIRAISDPFWSARMADLVRETMSRTGGSDRWHDWPQRIAFAQAHPNLARIVGLFHTDQQDSNSLLAFAVACHHGDYAHYDTAASTRRTDLKMPLNYALGWDLMCWAKQHGATWFDFGGVTAGHHVDNLDPLGGISDFKRYFSRNVIEVGGEWVLEPHWLRTRIARAVSGAAARVARLRHDVFLPRRAAQHA